MRLWDIANCRFRIKNKEPPPPLQWECEGVVFILALVMCRDQFEHSFGGRGGGCFFALEASADLTDNAGPPCLPSIIPALPALYSTRFIFSSFRPFEPYYWALWLVLTVTFATFDPLAGGNSMKHKDLVFYLQASCRKVEAKVLFENQFFINFRNQVDMNSIFPEPLSPRFTCWMQWNSLLGWR